jgi:hypothetical protein
MTWSRLRHILRQAYNFQKSEEMRFNKLIAILLGAAHLMGCGGMSNPTNAQLSGSWHLILSSNISGTSPTLDLFVVQTGTTLASSQVAMGVATCSSSGTMAGSISGKSISMVFTGNDGDTVSVTGTAETPTSFSGTYTSVTSGCGISGEMGTVSAELIPSMQGANWTGSTQSTRYSPGATTFTMNITEDSSGNIMGTVTFTGSTGSSSSCTATTGTVSIRGAQLGNQFGFSDTSPDGFSVGGTTDNMAKAVNGGYFVSGCAGDGGTCMISRP